MRRLFVVESNRDGKPFSRNDRSVVYARAKGELDTLPFGTQKDVYTVGYEWINHSLAPVHPDPTGARIMVGGDVVWQIGTGYFSCRNHDGTFNLDQFTERALLPNVQMIELKLSQGAKPGHGGILVNAGFQIATKVALGAAGLKHPRDLKPWYLNRRVSALGTLTYASIYPSVEPGALLSTPATGMLANVWAAASADRF